MLLGSLRMALPAPDAAIVDLRAEREVWRFGLTKVPRIGSGPLDETLLEILGSAPQLIGLRVRSLLSETSAKTVAPLTGIDAGNSPSAIAAKKPA